MSLTLSLTLAIPVFNDRVPLLRLLARAGTLGAFTRVVVVDDGSDIALEMAELTAALNAPDIPLRLLRHDAPRGPGPARNQALEMVDTDHLLFIDADDLPTREIAPLLRDLEGHDFDFCLFQHHDTRQEQGLLWGQMPWDQRHWRDAGVALGALSEVAPETAAHLCRTANYPWNKIYRTAYLRAHAIACSDILLHEDVELHWRSFIHARHILASDRIGVIHFVSDTGARMTNRTGPERLAVFGPLARIATEIEAEIETGTETGTQASDIYALPFARFAIGLIDWISGNLDPGHRDRFNDLTRAFVTDHVPPAIAREITRTDPGLAARVLTLAT